MNNELFQQAKASAVALDYNKALELYGKCLQDNENPPQVGELGLIYHQIGNCLMKLQSYYEAIEAYTQAAADTVSKPMGLPWLSIGPVTIGGKPHIVYTSQADTIYADIKLDSLLLREISMIISQEINDPKLGFPTVTEVDVAADLNTAKVYVSFLGKNYKKRDGIDALRRAKGHIKSLLAKRIKIRKIPDLTFIVDDTLDKADRIEELLSK